MDTAASRYNKGFTDEDEDDDDFGKRDGSSQKELNVRLDGKNSTDQRPSTPRSKHSATEQRRRSKINDRFQILRDLIPQSDQKRDKASFLLEVIEYVQFLQEKVQRYESAYSGWNQDTAKLMPWKKPQGTVEATVDPFHVIKNGNVPLAPVFSGEDTVPPAPVILAGDQTLLEDNVSSGLTNQAAAFSTPVQPYMAGSAGGGDMLNEQELAIDEGTISISTAYSQGLLQALTQALHNSGIDLSQSSISVQINLGKKAFNRPVSNMKDMEDPSSANQAIGDSRVGSSGEEQEQPKRHKKS